MKFVNYLVRLWLNLNSLNILSATFSTQGIENIFPIPLFLLYFSILFTSISSRPKNIVMMAYFLIQIGRAHV